ncbi:PIN domain-containing protein [Flagellimonas sp. 2504JD1-5]
MKHVVVLDTNILRADFLFKSNHFRILKEYLKITNSTLIIPTIVIQELVHLYRLELQTKFEDLNSLKDRINRNLLLDSVLDFNPDANINLEEQVFKYQEYIENQLKPFLRQIDHEDAFLPELVRRSIEKIKPISRKGQEFRDALLWLTLMNYIKKQKFELKVSFITNNVKDFADETKMALHPDLMKEIMETGISFYFYRSLTDFTQNTAITITDISKEWLVESLDWEGIQVTAESTVENIDPSYFYEYYYGNKIDKSDLEGWDVVYASYYRDIEGFYIYETTEKNNYTVEVDLYGNAVLEFESKEGKFFQKDVDFGTKAYLIIKQMKIIEVKLNPYGEEAGLDFGPSYEAPKI